MSYNPELLPKIRSEYLMSQCREMPCTLRIAGFIPGETCEPRSTVVGCHLPTIGKGMSTKVSDLFVAAGCAKCHDIIDGRDKTRWTWICDNYPVAAMQRLMNGLAETQSMLIGLGVIVVPRVDEIVEHKAITTGATVMGALINDLTVRRNAE